LAELSSLMEYRRLILEEHLLGETRDHPAERVRSE
jgi:hypothetical protein